MALKAIKTLIATDDTATAAQIAQRVATSFHGDVCIVDTLTEAKELVAAKAYDVVIASEKLTDGIAIELLEKDDSDSTIVILFAKKLDTNNVIAAMRKGAVDFLEMPADLGRLAAIVSQAVKSRRKRFSDRNRSERLRQLSSRLVRDRRELRQRVDLLCRDLVQAYRHLAEKVVDLDLEGTKK